MSAAFCVLLLQSGLAQVITTVAGTESIFAGDGLKARQAPLGLIRGVAIDRSGNLFLTDSDNSMVMKVGTDGILRVLAGNGIGSFSGDGGPAINASLHFPADMAVDATGNVYFADVFNNRIRVVTTTGIITTAAGNGEGGFSGDGGPAAKARLRLGSSGGLAFDATGNLYISDSGSNRIRKMTPDGIITTVAGNGQPGFSGDNVLATSASIENPKGIAADTDGNLYLCDNRNNRIRKVARNGIITTVAGNGQPGFSGDGSQATSASILFCTGVALDAVGNLYFLDDGNGRIRKVALDGVISTVAGDGEAGFIGDGGPAMNSRLNAAPAGALAADKTGNLYVADTFNLRVRKVSSDSLISTAAGLGPSAAPGDGGPATSAAFFVPLGIAFDSAGALYISENSRNRVRKVSADGVIRTVAGNGEAGFSGDGGLATQASLSGPYKVTLDTAGNLFIADRQNHRIRKVTPDGNISTVAGNGQLGFSGDGGLATGASLFVPDGVAVDAAGNLFIADSGNGRIRKVTSDGKISTVAGGGPPGFLGDGGLATSAFLTFPACVTVDDAGILYICDLNSNRIRKVKQGIISTLAGNGRRDFTGDGTPAVSASLSLPEGVTVDLAGNVFIADSGNNRIRRVSPDGIITTIAGTGEPGFSGDGGPATAARLDLPGDVALAPSGDLYLSDTSNGRIRAILGIPPSFTVFPAALSFTAKSTGPVTGEQRLALLPSTPGLLFAVAVSTSQGGNWLRATPTEGGMPTSVRITADPSTLAPGTYSGTITVTAANAVPPVRTASMKFVVDPALPAKLAAKPDGLSFTFVEKSPRDTQALRVANTGGGSLSFTATASTSSGGGWLAVSPSGGTATASTQVSLTVTANPAGLDPGTYSGQIAIASAVTGERVVVPVTMTISALTQTILLSQTGVTFTAVANGGRVLPQSIGVLNTGQGVMNWSVAASTLSGGQNWLVVSPASGSSAANSTDVPVFDIRVDAAGLAPGVYYGQVRVTAPGAANSPQLVAVVLNLLPAGSDPGPVVQPAGLIFTGVAGGASPGSQNLLVSNPTSRDINYVAGRLTSDGQNWFVHAPTGGTVTSGTPARVVVQPDLTGLTPGIRRGVLTLLFLEDGVTRTVNLLLNVLPASASASAGRASAPGPQSACAPTTLLPVFTLLSDNFNVSAAWPSPIELSVVDDCGTPLVSGSVAASFSNGDPVLALAPLRDGRWSATWQPRNSSVSQVTVTAIAQDSQLNIHGSAQVTGGLQANQIPPVVASGAVVNAASFAPQAPLAPGTLVSIFGSKLAESAAAASGLPLDTKLGSTSVIVAGRSLPLLYVSDQQINAMLPYDVAVNTRHQLVVVRGTIYGVPEPVTVATAQPAVFTKKQNGSGQGVVVDINNQYVEPGNAARVGDAIVIYCSGLGPVDPPVVAGAPVPLSPLSHTTNPVMVTIGGVQAEVFFAGLTPLYSGLYQVNAIVQPGTPLGDAVPVVLTVAGQTSPPVTIAVQ